MSSAISATSSASISDNIFAKLDTKKKGYIDAADLTAAAGTDSAAASKAAEMIKQTDSDGDGKITKSELSVAIDKMSEQLNAQMDQSRTANATGGAKPADGGEPHGGEPHGGGGEPHGGGGAPPAKGASSSTASESKYIAAADTNTDGTVSADEAAAYKKAQAASAEAKALAQVQEYKDNSGDSAAVPSAAVDTSA